VSVTVNQENLTLIFGIAKGSTLVLGPLSKRYALMTVRHLGTFPLGLSITERQGSKWQCKKVVVVKGVNRG
jgi:hypothetical protein